MTRVDLTALGHQRFRDRVRAALNGMGDEIRESEGFWFRFMRGSSRSEQEPTLVVGDLSRVVREFQNTGVHRWIAAIRRARPYFVVFVRTEKDRRCAPLVDDLLKASDMRVDVCNDAHDSSTIYQTLRTGVSSLRPDTLLAVRFLPDPGGLWAQFGDGLAGALTWSALGVSVDGERLIPESATVNAMGSAVEIVTHAAALFEIDAASVRAVLDAAFASRLSVVASESDQTFGVRLRGARERAGLTQIEMGDRTGLDQAVISRIERGRTRPRIDTLRRIAGGLGLSVAELLSAPVPATPR